MLCYNNLVGRACCYTESFSVHYLLRFSKQCFHVDVYIVSFLFFEVTEGVNDSIKTGMHDMEFRHNAMQKIIQLILSISPPQKKYKIHWTLCDTDFWHTMRWPPSRPGKPKSSCCMLTSTKSIVLFHTIGQTEDLKDHLVPGEDAPAWPPTSEQRPLTYVLKAESWWIQKSRTNPSSLPEPHLFLGEVLLVSSMFSDVRCKGCHPKAACPRRLIHWRQEPPPF